MVISNSRFTVPISFKHPWCPAAWLLKKIGKRKLRIDKIEKK